MSYLPCAKAQPIDANTMIFKVQLFWDKDGFWEIHLKYDGDLVVVA